MRRRLKRSTRQHIIVSVLCVFIFGGVFLTAYFTVTSNLKKNYQSRIDSLSHELESKKIYVYQAKKDISAGSRITKDLLTYSGVLSEQPQSNFITESEIGKVALIDIKTGTEVLKTMLTGEVADDTLREVEFNTFLLSSNLKEHDTVDIRILFPNGESYVVLSKKTARNLDLENSSCFMWLDSEEILRVSGAIVDCFINEGSRLYTVKYIEPQIQEASLITYTPGTDVLKLIQEDPNVVRKAADKVNESVRQELDRRLTEFYSRHGSEAYWNNYKFNHPADSRVKETGSNNDLTGDTNESESATELLQTDQPADEGEEEIYYVD